MTGCFSLFFRLIDDTSSKQGLIIIHSYALSQLPCSKNVFFKYLILFNKNSPAVAVVRLIDVHS